MEITRFDQCRSCGWPLPEQNLLDLGYQYVVDFPLPEEAGRGASPLELCQCDHCQLVQLRYSVDAPTLYRKFWYRSGINEQMRLALRDVVLSAMGTVDVKDGDVVCDIGTNDGELLTNYPQSVHKIGFEPAHELAAFATVRKDLKNVSIVNDFFKSGYLEENSCKVITAIAMFYDLDEPEPFLKEVVSALNPFGVFVVQMNYLALMLRNLTFDNISHEHVCYYSLLSLNKLFKRVGLNIFHVETNDVNGGSMRVYASKNPEVFIDSSVQFQLIRERDLISYRALQNFCNRVESNARVLREFITKLTAAGKKIYVYGASTRGISLLQTVFKGEDTSKYLIAAAERDEKKWGRVMAGTRTPIIPEEGARKQADYFLLLPYHFWASVRERENAFLRQGGKFIIPLPFPRVMEMSRLAGQSIPLALTLDEDLEKMGVVE